MKRLLSLLSLLLVLAPATLTAQSTFQRVLTIFDDNGCATSACHGNGAAGLWLTGSEDFIFDQMNNVPSKNPVSAERGYKIVDPGYPDRSTLNRKCNDGLYPTAELLEGEGANMPIGGDVLDPIEIETIRQWILWGAPKNGNAFNNNYYNAMVEYHTEGGIAPTEQPEAPEQGFQIYLGPIFLQPEQEVEYLKKHVYEFEEGFEVDRMQNFMSDFSHHFILYRYNALPTDVPEGLRNLTFESTLTTEFLNIWQDNRDYQLPEGTAFFFDETTFLDLNFHVKNYSTTSVLAADCYINVHTKEIGTAEKEMKSTLQINFGLNIPSNQPGHIETIGLDNSQDWNVWMLTSHTHQYGTDYDMYLEENGQEGIQLYEGQHDTDYTFFTGTYDYAHPPVRYFDDFLELPGGSTTLHHAEYHNTGNSNVGFGVTTDDEMMLAIILYTLGDSHLEEPIANDLPFAICEDAEPFEILSNFESGALGDGVYGNLFYPDRAGIGAHEITINCCDPSKLQTHTITVEALPEIPEISTSIAGLSTTPGFASYQWYFEGDPIEGANGLSLATEEAGNYTVEVTNTAGCSRVSESYEIIGTGIETFSDTFHWTLRPNPTNGNTQIVLELEKRSNIKLTVYNMLGMQTTNILEQELNSGEQVINLDLSDYAKGIYFVKFDLDGKIYSQKLLKK